MTDLARQPDAAGSTVVLISTDGEVRIEDLFVASGAAGFLPKSQLSASAGRGILRGQSSHAPA